MAFVKNGTNIVLYFKQLNLRLVDVTPKHIQEYYQYELTQKGVSVNTVIHRHANIRKALQYAFKIGLLNYNPADRIERRMKEKFVGSVCGCKELDTCESRCTCETFALNVSSKYQLCYARITKMRAAFPALAFAVGSSPPPIKKTQPHGLSFLILL